MVDTWWTHSEGWIALMQLAAISQVTAGAGEPVASMMAKARTSIAAFLSTSLIAHLPADLHTFMLIASVPNVVCPELAQCLTRDRLGSVDAAAMLNDIAQRGLFLSPLDQDGTWYRFHPLFRDMLLEELVEVFGQGQVNVMHLAAAQWFARNQRTERALDHLLIAGDTDGAANLIASHAQVALVHDKWIELDSWIRRLPAAIADQHVEVILANAMIAQVQGMFGDIPALLDLASAGLSRSFTVTDSHAQVLQAEIDLLRMFTTQAGNDDASERAALLDRIFHALAGSDRYSELVAVPVYAIAIGQRDPKRAQSVIDNYLATAEGANDFDVHRRMWARSAQVILSRHSGSIERYHDLGASLFSMARSANSQRMLAQARFYLGAAEWERNHIEAAIGHLRDVVSDPATGPMYYILAACTLASALDLTGNIVESRAVIEHLRDRGVATGSPGIDAKLRQLAAELAIRHGETPGGLALLQQALLTQTSMAIRITEEFPVGLTVPLIQSGAPGIGRARDILVTVARTTRDRHLPGPQICCEVLLAWIDKLEGRPDNAHERLASALQQASDLGRVRTVIGLGPFVLPLLEWHTAAGYETDYCDFLIESLEYEHGLATIEHPTGTISDATSGQTTPGDTEELTNREIDVLFGLQRRLSNKEIADELSISHLTVKSHARSIYFKLGVSGRRQAIQRARELGLLPQRL